MHARHGKHAAANMASYQQLNRCLSLSSHAYASSQYETCCGHHERREVLPRTVLPRITPSFCILLLTPCFSAATLAALRCAQLIVNASWRTGTTYQQMRLKGSSSERRHATAMPCNDWQHCMRCTTKYQRKQKTRPDDARRRH